MGLPQAAAAHPGAPERGGTSRRICSAKRFLLTRPLLEAIRATEPVVLLIDEVDRLDVETEALLLEVLSDYQVSIPELGTVAARQVPLVFLTSNSSRELSEALKRRCLYLFLDYPSLEREREIVLSRVPGISEETGQPAQPSGPVACAGLELKKRPSVSETLDWGADPAVAGCRRDRTRRAPGDPARTPEAPERHRGRGARR